MGGMADLQGADGGHRPPPLEKWEAILKGYFSRKLIKSFETGSV